VTLDSSAPDYRARILAEQADAERRLASLSRRFTAIVEGSEFTTDDDEHDPEGSTIAFERAQVSALLADARRDVEELTAALARLDAGTYGTCIRCGRSIADVRLDALPAVRTCIECSG
jgi:DnaK suppressor protein